MIARASSHTPEMESCSSKRHLWVFAVSTDYQSLSNFVSPSYQTAWTLVFSEACTWHPAYPAPVLRHRGPLCSVDSRAFLSEFLTKVCTENGSKDARLLMCASAQ